MKNNYLLNMKPAWLKPKAVARLSKFDETFLSGMIGIKPLSAFLLVLSFWMVSLSANAQSPDLTGNTWDGWTLVGTNSDFGIYAKGSHLTSPTPQGFTIYTAVFESSGPTELPGNLFNKPTNEFAAGNKILAIGMERTAGDWAYPFMKLDFDNNSFTASTTGPVDGSTAGDGQTSGGGWATIGDASVQFREIYAGQPAQNSIYTENGLFSGGTGSAAFNSHPCGSYGCGNGLPGLRGVLNQTNGYFFKMYFDLTTLPTAYPNTVTGGTQALGTILDMLTISIAAIGTTNADATITVSTALPPKPVRVYSDAAETDLVSSHATIQAAIDAATTLSGYVVRVDAGTYNEFVDVSKELSIRGANYGVDPNTGSRGDESIIGYNGDYAVEIFASNVTFDGFSVSNTLGNAVRISVGRQNPGDAANVSNVTVSNNIATGAAILSCPSCTGLYMGVLSFDNFEQAQYISSGIAFTNNRLTVSESNGRGITMSAYNGSQLTGDITISGNEILTSGSPTSIVGIELRSTSDLSTQNVAISDNTISGFTIGVWPRVFGAGAWNVTVTGNFVSSGLRGIQVNAPAGNIVSLSNNSITFTSTAILHEGAGTLNASCNWYGSALAADVQASIAGSVNFEPWLLDGTDNDPAAIGFQPVPGACAPLDEEAPVVTNVVAAPAALGTAATLTATATDNVAVTAASYTIDDGTAVPFSFTSGSPVSLSASISGLEVGVYKVCVTAEDAAGNISVAECAYLSVYDPSASFVTGGGWINSPPGAMPASPEAIGKANFGFVSRYKRGKNGFTSEVDGNTEFQFQTGGLSFKSTMHESGSLVISGQRATYRGTGTINEEPGYKFVVVAIDGNWNGQNNPDRFRIKISTTSDDVIYDNQIGSDENTEDASILGGGSIVIHEVKTKGKNNRVEDLGTMEEQLNALFENGETELESNKILVYPNPASETSNIKVSLSQDADVTIRIFDSAGRLVMEERGYHETSFVRTLNLQSFSNGIYHVVVQINHQVVTKRLVKQ
jgi:hypothetical protein